MQKMFRELFQPRMTKSLREWVGGLYYWYCMYIWIISLSLCPGPMYRYCCLPSTMVSARIFRHEVLSYFSGNQVSQETGRPGEDMGQLPAAVPVEPEELLPALKNFN